MSGTTTDTTVPTCFPLMSLISAVSFVTKLTNTILVQNYY